jgi:hypothetical protein
MDNTSMKTIKHLKQNKLMLGGVTYKPYMIGDLPNKFGCISYGESDGIYQWFGYKGFCYVIDEKATYEL